MPSVIKMAGGSMRYIVSIIAFFASVNAFAVCTLSAEPNVQGCKLTGIITSDASRLEGEKVWVCINYRAVDEENNLAKFIISGRAKAPTSRLDAIERAQCDLVRRTVAIGDSPKDTSCGDYKIYTSLQTQRETRGERQGYRVDLVVETSELRTGSAKYAGTGKSVCEIEFIEAQLLESKKEEDEPGLHWPDCR